MWILIITILDIQMVSGQSSSIESIEISSKDRCVEAAAFYVKSVKNTNHIISTTCIKK